MRMTWKHTGKTPLTQFRNLPFDQEPPSVADIIVDKADKFPTEEASGVKDAVKLKGLVDFDHENDKLAQVYEEEGNKLAEDGKYREALGKWETAITFLPQRAVLHEQKAQLLLELGDPWSALKSALRATQLEPTWAEAWITLGRAQLNFGEPDTAIESFNRALTIKPESIEAINDRQRAMHLITRRKQLHSTGLSSNESRFIVKDNTDGGHS